VCDTLSYHSASSGIRKLITQPPDWKIGRAVTLHELDQQRAEFWSTRVEGNTYIWRAIQAACEHLLSGDEVMCNSILDASEVIHSGSLATCFDSLGHEYIVPQLCYSNPKDMQTTLSEARALDGSSKNRLIASGTAVVMKMQVCAMQLLVFMSMLCNSACLL
jgi:Ubiquitin-binding domain